MCECKGGAVEIELVRLVFRSEAHPEYDLHVVHNAAAVPSVGECVWIDQDGHDQAYSVRGRHWRVSNGYLDSVTVWVEAFD